MKRLKVAVVTINQPSLSSACKLAPYLDAYEVDYFGKKDLKHDLDHLHTYNKLDDIMPTAWANYDALICILAVGAVVRKIAPLLVDKSSDPAVLVINLTLDKIVPLLSGHLGGANELANALCSKIPNAINFISTATDQTKTLAFDMEAKHNGWQIANLKALANISNRLLNKQSVQVATYKSIFETLSNRENLTRIDFDAIGDNCVVIAPNISSDSLTLKPKVYLGIGCNRDTSCEEIEGAVMEFLTKHNLKIEQIEAIASFEAKQDEVGLLAFAKKYDLKIHFYPKDAINGLENAFSPSASTQFFGLKGVAEPSAILCSKYKELIIQKEVYNKKITIAGAV